MKPEVGFTYEDDQGRVVTIIKKVKTCCSPEFFHGEVIVDEQLNVFAYDQEGCMLNFQFVQQKQGRLIKEIH